MEFLQGPTSVLVGVLAQVLHEQLELPDRIAVCLHRWSRPLPLHLVDGLEVGLVETRSQGST